MVLNIRSEIEESKFFCLSGSEIFTTTQTSVAAYVISGQNTKNIVAQYYNDGWQKLEDLNRGRYGHGSILVGDKILVIGGWALDGLGE